MTEAGAIPEDWRLESIGTLGVVGRGRVISHREIAKSSNPTYPVYSSQTSNDGIMGYLDTFDFEGDYITWTTDGANAGTVFYRNGRFNCTNVCGTIKVQYDDPRFVAMVLSQIAPRHVSRQVGNPKLMNGVMKRVMVPLPPTIEEQCAIATALSDVDELLHTLDRLVEKKRDLKQAAMQQLLTGRTRLPGFNDSWDTKTLGQLGDWKGGITPSMARSEFWEGGTLPWVSSGDVKTAVLSKTARSTTTMAVVNGAAVVVPANSILVVTRSGILRKYLPVAMTATEMAINQDIKALVPDNSYDPAYLHHALNASGPLILATCMKSGTTVESVEFRWLKAFEIAMPRAIEEQQAIAVALSEMDAEIGALENRREKIANLKKAIMQELLTGKTRLFSPEPAYA